MEVLINHVPHNIETLGEIAAIDLRKAKVLKNYGFDFCCGGKKTLQVACAEKGLDPARIEQELLLADKNLATRPLPYNDWSPGFLADYIFNTHHSYIRKIIPELLGYSIKVAGVHGGQHPELLRIRQLLEQIDAELNIHMLKEEMILFPYIKQLDNLVKKLPTDTRLHLETVELPIHMMETEHEQVGMSLEAIRSLSNHFTVPADGCASYRLLYDLLKEFEEDMHIHIHLENNILFPKAIELEKVLNAMSSSA